MAREPDTSAEPPPAWDPRPHGARAPGRSPRPGSGPRGLDPRYERWRWQILFITWLAYVGFYLTRKSFSVAKIELADPKGMGWSKSQMAWVDGAFGVTYALGNFLWGALGDKFGPRRVVAAGLFASVAVALLMGASSSVAVFGLLFGLQGLCQSSGWGPLAKNVGEFFSLRERGRVMGLWCTNMPVGNFVAAGIAATAAGYLGWRYAFWAPAGCLLLIAVAFLVLQRDRPEDVGLPPIEEYHGEAPAVLEAGETPEEEPEGSWKVVTEVLTNKMVWLLAATYLLVKPTRYLIMFWAPLYINERLGAGVVESSVLEHVGVGRAGQPAVERLAVGPAVPGQAHPPVGARPVRLRGPVVLLRLPAAHALRPGAGAVRHRLLDLHPRNAPVGVGGHRFRDQEGRLDRLRPHQRLRVGGGVDRHDHPRLDPADGRHGGQRVEPHLPRPGAGAGPGGRAGAPAMEPPARPRRVRGSGPAPGPGRRHPGTGGRGRPVSQVLPRHARVVIIGGGVVGCSAAYHLARLGWRDVLLLEQGELAGGTTWHAAGMIGRLRTSSSMARINDASAKLYAALEAETGHPTGWKQVGSLVVARTDDRMVQLRRTAALAEYNGIRVEIIDARAARDKCPVMRADDLRGAAWLPGDGKVVPKETTLALAQGARQRGATVLENVRVLDVLHERRRAVGVRTADGPVAAEVVVLCGGMWARQLALRCGVNVPLYPVEHHYVVSNPIPGAFDELPCTRDPDAAIYFRGEGDAVLLGAFQKYTKPWLVDRVPDDFKFQLLEADWEHFAQPLADGQHRIPALAESGIARFVNGPESFTPDNEFLLGESAELGRLYIAAGFNSAGIACAGGAGEALAQWIVGGEQPMDLWSVDVRRFTPAHNNRTFLRSRVTEALGLHYQTAWPNREMESGRGLRRSPLHDRLAGRGACFGQKAGWERPLWFARGGAEPRMEYSFGRQNWFDAHAVEHRAARENVALFDQSSFAKFILKGRDAVTVLQRLCGNDVDVAVGCIVYTGLFNERGTFESDLTVLRQAEDEYYIVSATAQAVRDLDWIRRHVRPDEHAELVDVTAGCSVLGLMGPDARQLLAPLTEANLSNAAFPFGTARRIGVGLTTVRALRVTYVGELGWELHVPTDQAVVLYDTLLEAGRPLGLVDAGHYAINSLRLEKGYRAWGADLSVDDTPLEAGLGFAVKFDKPVAFLGREALLRQKDRGVRKRLASFVLADPGPVLWGGERIFRDGRCVGYTTSAAYGHTVGGAVALGYVRHTEPVTSDFVLSSHYTIDVAGREYPARVSLAAPYDPKNERIRM
jgi:4-methylaminobutanoate oxidase (formaldehyde-forming)